MAGLEGRFYEAEFPQQEEIVMVQVKRIVDMGAYVSLLEYNGREGMMLLSELSKRRIRSVQKLLRVGRTEICMVIRADHDKGYIDLSKRRVDPEDAKLKDESFAKAKAVHGIMRHVAGLHDIPVEELCNKVAWPLYKKYTDAHEAFRKHINEELNMWEEIDFSQPGQDLTDLQDKLKEDIETDLRRRLITQALRMRAKVEVSCSEFEGIDAIKEALMKGLEATVEDCELKVKLIAHPLFMLTCTCKDKALGFKTLDNAIALIKESILKSSGEFKLALAPELVTHAQEEKEESGGDSDESGDDDGSGDEEASDMGDLKEEDLKALMEKTKDLKEDEDD